MRVAIALAALFWVLLILSWGSWWTWVNVAGWIVGIPLFIVGYYKVHNYRNPVPVVKPMIEDDEYN